MAARRYSILACALSLMLGLTACAVGNKKAHPRNADANNNGFYVDGGPISYQLEISRELNQYATEDSQYVRGLAAGTTPPTPGQLWYGVFLWAKNQTSQPQTTTDNFDIVDTQGNHYSAIKLDSDINGYAWASQRLQPLAIEPGPDTQASFDPTQGGLVLFKLSTSVYANRPLTLEIRAPSGQLEATISLDL
ncbi:MAG TPA: hypothetical protein VIL82_06925 [Solirubrobacteraceae bacterium]